MVTDLVWAIVVDLSLNLKHHQELKHPTKMPVILFRYRNVNLEIYLSSKPFSNSHR